MPYDVTLPNGEVLHVDDTNPLDPQITITKPGDPNIPNNPLTPATITDNTPGPTTAAATGGTGAFDLSALKWLGALVLLWIILTALTEASPNAQMFGRALAGLVLVGALFALGPGAISNVKNVWTQTSGSPVQGPNPVPGA